MSPPEPVDASASVNGGKRWPRMARFTTFIRRVHLYAGLFLLPWVFLYGITGAMFNHHGLLSSSTKRHIDAGQLSQTSAATFPSAGELAVQVTDAIQAAAGDATITLMPDHAAEFTNNVAFDIQHGRMKHTVQLDPVRRSADVIIEPVNSENPEPMLGKIRQIKLANDPQAMARSAVRDILSKAGIDTTNAPVPAGWCKLNFLAEVDGEPARVTYVLRDGHVDITRYTGEDGMTPRQLFLRLHTSHGQPPHWNARMVWSLFADAMAIAMVTWGVTGLIMWWQLKRTRIIGACVIVLSLACAVGIYLAMTGFYATTKL